MTIEEFNNTRFGAKMFCLYRGEEHLIGSVDFDEKLIGLSVPGTDEYTWVRCENITLK